MCFSKAETRFKPAMTARDISRRPEERQSAEVVEHGGAERGEDGGQVSTPKDLIRSLPALSPSPLGFCDLARGFPARSIREQGI